FLPDDGRWYLRAIQRQLAATTIHGKTAIDAHVILGAVGIFVRMDVQAADDSPSVKHAIVQVAMTSVIRLLVAKIACGHISPCEIPKPLGGDFSTVVVAVMCHWTLSSIHASTVSFPAIPNEPATEPSSAQSTES